MLCQLELLTRLFSIYACSVERPRSSYFAFFVYGMRATPGAEFLDRKFVGLRLLVLGRRVVA